MELSYSAFIIPSQLGKHANPLHRIPIEVGQPVLGLHIFRNFTEEKIDLAPVHMSIRGLIICVNS